MATDRSEELARLAELRSTDVISDDEFVELKRQLIGGERLPPTRRVAVAIAVAVTVVIGAIALTYWMIQRDPVKSSPTVPEAVGTAPLSTESDTVSSSTSPVLETTAQDLTAAAVEFNELVAKSGVFDAEAAVFKAMQEGASCDQMEAVERWFTSIADPLWMKLGELQDDSSRLASSDDPALAAAAEKAYWDLDALRWEIPDPLTMAGRVNIYQRRSGC